MQTPPNQHKQVASFGRRTTLASRPLLWALCGASSDERSLRVRSNSDPTAAKLGIVSMEDLERPITWKQGLLACVAVIFLFGPPLALVVFPSSPAVTVLFGGYRLFIFYIVGFGVFASLEWPAIRHAFGQPKEEQSAPDRES